MDKHRTLSSLDLCDPITNLSEQFHVFVSQESEDSLELVLIDLNEHRVWSCRTQFSALQPNNVPLSLHEYSKSVVLALSGQGNYEYELKGQRDGDDDVVTLVVSVQPDPKFEIFVNWAVFRMEKDSEYGKKMNLVFSLISKSLNALRSENRKLKKQLQKETIDKEEAIRTCDQAVVQKNEIENRLVSAFLPILNAKKARIRELLEELQGKSLSKSTNHQDEREDDHGSAQEEEEDEHGSDVQQDSSPGRESISKEFKLKEKAPKRAAMPILFQATPAKQIRVRKRHRPLAKPSVISENEEEESRIKKKKSISRKKKSIESADEEEDEDFDTLLKGL